MKDKRTDASKSKGQKAGAANPVPAPTVKVDPPRPLTLKEKRVLEFLEAYIKARGIAPSYQEICNHFGFASYNSVQRYLRQLEAKGYIHMPWGNQKRAVTLLQPSSAVQALVDELHKEAESSVTPLPSQVASESLSLPLLGRVAAGEPIEAYEHDEFIEVPASLVRNADRTYALRVQGQSMIEDGILDGDVILVQRQSYASNAEIVVAVVGEEATVKRFYSHSVDIDDFDDDGAPRLNIVSNNERRLNKSGPPPSRARKMIELRPANSTMSSLWYDPQEVEIRGVVVGLIRKF